MATDTKTTPAVEQVVKIADLVLTKGKYTVRYADLPEKSRVRMAQKAFNELLQDSLAFSKKDLEGKTDAEVMAMKAKALDERFNSILSGEFKVGGGGARLPQIERVIRDIAEERLKAIASAKGVPMPKGDVLKAALDKITTKGGAALVAEAQSRIDSAKDMSDELGDILS